MKTIKILGVTVSNTSEKEALEFIIRSLEKKGKKVKIFTPNPEIIMAAHKDHDFKKVVNTAHLALPDGIGVVWAAGALGKQLQTRVTGVDFMETLCREAAKRGFTVGFLGGKPKIAEKAAECLLQKYPSLKIAFTGSQWKSGKAIDILFVAFGWSKQERWIDKNLPKIPVKVAMGVGGSFDYISGVVPRAPKFVRSLGLEWLFRLIRQPWRFRRQLVLPKFFFLVLKEKFFPNGF